MQNDRDNNMIKNKNKCQEQIYQLWKDPQFDGTKSENEKESQTENHRQ